MPEITAHYRKQMPIVFPSINNQERWRVLKDLMCVVYPHILNLRYNSRIRTSHSVTSNSLSPTVCNTSSHITTDTTFYSTVESNQSSIRIERYRSHPQHRHSKTRWKQPNSTSSQLPLKILVAPPNTSCWFSFISNDSTTVFEYTNRKDEYASHHPNELHRQWESSHTSCKYKNESRPLDVRWVVGRLLGNYRRLPIRFGKGLVTNKYNGQK